MAEPKATNWCRRHKGSVEEHGRAANVDGAVNSGPVRDCERWAIGGGDPGGRGLAVMGLVLGIRRGRAGVGMVLWFGRGEQTDDTFTPNEAVEARKGQLFADCDEARAKTKGDKSYLSPH